MTRWYFEELATFIEITGALAFWSIKDNAGTPPRMIEMWTHLRSYAMYFVFYQPGQHTTEQIRTAQNHIFKFAEFAEAKMGGRLCSLLLHRATMHLPEQVLTAGPSGYMREDFGERGVREGKERVTRHAAKDAAQASAACCMLDMSLRAHKRRWPEIEAPARKTDALKRHRPVDAGGPDGVQLHQLTEANQGIAKDQVCSITAALHTGHVIFCSALPRVCRHC